MTVKEKKRGRPKGSGQLAQSHIVDCAKRLMQLNGKIPSIRQISGGLEVDPMAIYYYFSNKNALLEAVTVSLIAGIYEPEIDGVWEIELKKLCKSYLNLLKNYPGLLETLLTMQSDGPATVFVERFYGALAPLDLNKTELKNALYLLADYLHGFALALSCNPDNEKYSLNDVDGPLDFYIQALSKR